MKATAQPLSHPTGSAKAWFAARGHSCLSAEALAQADPQQCTSSDPCTEAAAVALLEVAADSNVRAPASSAGAARSGYISIYCDLFKARLTLMVLFSTVIGFYVGFRGPVDYALLVNTVLGTALVASGASALNQFFERGLDALMQRTQDRPLPSARLQPGTVLLVGCSTAVVGLVYLALTVNYLTTALGAASLCTYLFVYTPLKRVTWLNTVVGAVPGALPVLMGWTAARRALDAGGLTLFCAQALWQVPHFLAIAWIYRQDYAKAGFRMLPVIDPKGRRSGRQAVAFSLVLFPVSLCPFALKLAGPVYLAGAIVLGLALIVCAIQFARQLTIARARQLFYLSILYLPLLLAMMALDKR